jgi:uncharacterized protein (TIGR02284 family)
MTEHLSSLHTALLDAREGYGKAIEQADDANLGRQLRSVDRLHAAAHVDIHRLLASRGATIDEDGSLMGNVHKAVVSVRSAIIGLDEGSLAAFASGEERNLTTYDDAIREESDPAARATLAGHRDALVAKIAEMKRQAEGK